MQSYEDGQVPGHMTDEMSQRELSLVSLAKRKPRGV